MNGYLELVRRGFVVITIDMAGHGYSDVAINALTKETYGALAAVEYAMSLPCVDESKIGVTGHSLGNEACYAAIANANIAEYPNPRIAAWVEGADTMRALKMTPELCEGLIWTESTDKYDEFDTQFFGAHTFLDGPLACGIVQIVYPGFAETSVTAGVFYTADGIVEAPNNGQRVNADSAYMIVNPSITHPMLHFSTTGTAITINGIYNGLGTPSGADYLSADQQVWPVCVVFELLGLIGFFMLLFPLVSILAKTRFFSDIHQSTELALPSAKSASELILWILTVVVSIAFSFAAYIKYYPQGNNALDPAVYAINDMPNGIGFWTVLCGIFALLLLLASFGVRKLLYRKSPDQVRNPFEIAKIYNVSQFFKTLLLRLLSLFLCISRYTWHAMRLTPISVSAHLRWEGYRSKNCRSFSANMYRSGWCSIFLTQFSTPIPGIRTFQNGSQRQFARCQMARRS